MCIKTGAESTFFIFEHFEEAGKFKNSTHFCLGALLFYEQNSFLAGWFGGFSF